MFGRNKAEKAKAKAQKQVDKLTSQIDKLRGQAERKAKKAGLKTAWEKNRWEHKAKKAFSQLQDYASQGYDWAAPRAQELADRARPYVEEAKDAGSDLLEKVRHDYIPRAQRAVHAANDAAHGHGSIADRARAASHAAGTELTTSQPVKKSRSVLKTLGWSAFIVGTAGAGYFLWKRSQPTDDPWSEAYWEDVDGEEVVEEAKDKAENAKDAAKEKAEEVKDEAKEGAKKAADTVKEKAGEVADKAKDKAQELADKAKESVEKAKK